MDLVVEITTFGYRHGEPPEGAHIVLNLRQHFRDPHVSPELRYLDATDQRVRDNVLGTPGVWQMISATVAQVRAFAYGWAPSRPIRVAVGCAGGRHRAATSGMELETRLRAIGFDVTLTHRDMQKAVIER